MSKDQFFYQDHIDEKGREHMKKKKMSVSQKVFHNSPVIETGVLYIVSEEKHLNVVFSFQSELCRCICQLSARSSYIHQKPQGKMV